MNTESTAVAVAAPASGIVCPPNLRLYYAIHACF